MNTEKIIKKAISFNKRPPTKKSPFVDYEYGLGYDSPDKYDIVKNSPVEHPSYYPVNYPFQQDDFYTEIDNGHPEKGDYADGDSRLYPKRDNGVKYRDHNRPKDSFEKHVQYHNNDQSRLNLTGENHE